MNYKIKRSISLMSDKLVLVEYKSYLTLVISIYMYILISPTLVKSVETGTTKGQNDGQMGNLLSWSQ